MSEASMTRRYLKILLGLSVVGAIVWFFATGTYQSVGAESIRDEILRFGPLGPLVFVCAFALIQPLGPSSHFFVIASALVWSPPMAFALSLLGAVGAQKVLFVFVRYLAGDWARARLPARFLEYESRFVEKPFRTVFVLRLFTFTAHFTTIAIAVSRVRFWPMFAANVLGVMPMIAFDVAMLDVARDWFG